MYNVQCDLGIILLNFWTSASLCGDFWINQTCIIYDLTNEQANYFIQAFFICQQHPSNNGFLSTVLIMHVLITSIQIVTRKS
jgi:hypothetical protein